MWLEYLSSDRVERRDGVRHCAGGDQSSKLVRLRAWLDLSGFQLLFGAREVARDEPRSRFFDPVIILRGIH